MADYVSALAAKRQAGWLANARAVLIRVPLREGSYISQLVCPTAADRRDRSVTNIL